MNNRIPRDIAMLLIGAAIATIFGILVAYPEMLASTRENAVSIESNKQQIELLWEAHSIEHHGQGVEGDSNR